MTAESPHQIEFRNLADADLAAAHELSDAMAWPHRLEDWRFMLSLGGGVAAVDQRGLAGVAMYWLHDERYATIGMVIVSPSRQGQGLGRGLMELALHRTGARRVVLHATEAGTPLYRRLGFEPGASVHQMQGVVHKETPLTWRETGRLRPIDGIEPNALAELDAEANGMRRSEMLSALSLIADGVVLERDGALAGFALLRRFGRGFVIGPVIAPDLDGAKLLIGHFLGSLSGQMVRVDVPAESGLTDWLPQFGPADVGTALRMTRGEAPAASKGAQCFALASQALG